MFNLSGPLLKADPYEGIQLIIPASSNDFIKKLDQFFLTENDIHPCKPERTKCTVNEKLQFDLSGTEVYIVTFPHSPKTLAEAALNYITTH